MSKYTTEVRFICENYAGMDESQGYASVDDIISHSRDRIFVQYPIWDEEYRDVLNSKILKHYYTREICAETVGLWKLWLNVRMDEIMPYFNKLYESAELEFNPLNDVNYQISHTGNGTDNQSRIDTRTLDTTDTITGTKAENYSENGSNTSTVAANGSNNSTVIDKYSDTPQGGLNGFDDNQSGLQYLTNARETNTTGSDTQNTTNSGSNTRSSADNVTTNDTKRGTGTITDATTGNITTTDQYIRTIQGKMGGESYSKMLKEYRDTLLNIDMQVIDSLKDLFFKLW